MVLKFLVAAGAIGAVVLAAGCMLLLMASSAQSQTEERLDPCWEIMDASGEDE